MCAHRNHRHDIIVIGGSSGALEELRKIVAMLPADLPASIFVTLHTSPESPGILADILSRAGTLRAKHPEHGEEIRPGTIYVAPPDSHLLVNSGYVKVSRGPRENRHRPAIDPMFRTAARAYRSRVAAIVLSGMLDDGSAGLMAVRAAGGLGIAQDPAEALSTEMPSRAIEYAGADYVLPIQEIASLIVTLADESLPTGSTPAEAAMPQRKANKKDKADLQKDANEQKEGTPSTFACPECRGVLWEVEEGKLLRFRCRVGHAYTAAALELSETAENALWVSLRTLEEKAALLRRMAAKTSPRIAASYNDQAKEYDAHAQTIRSLLIENQELEDQHKQKAQEIHAGNGGRGG
jgi:two-component system chemotaxis response regulator CheB